MLGAPEFDTYGVIKDFARNPNTANEFRLRMLLDRVNIQYNWDCLTVTTEAEQFAAMKRLRSGSWLYAGEPDKQAVTLNANSSIDEYKKACAMAGFDLTQADFDKIGIKLNG